MQHSRVVVVHRLRQSIIRALCSQIIVFTALEVFFALSYVIWAVWRGDRIRFLLRSEELTYGCLAAFPLLFLNYLLFFRQSSRRALGRRFSMERGEFLDTVIMPFVRTLTVTQAAVLSFAAGVGEELLFRGVLQAEVGVFVSSALFALLHFGPAVHKFKCIALLYFVTSLYLAAVSMCSLGTAVVTHVTYDLVALFYLILASNRQWRENSRSQ